LITLPFPIHSERDNVRTTVENVTGGAGNDILVAQAFSVKNVFNGLGGNDRIDLGDGDDTASGGDGDDQILGRVATTPSRETTETT